MIAQSNVYQGPTNTAQITLIKCCIGAIPGTRKIGDRTNPKAAKIPTVVNFRTGILAELPTSDCCERCRILFVSFLKHIRFSVQLYQMTEGT